jgi:hypothetical protein
MFYGGQRSLSLALEGVLDGIAVALDTHQSVPRIENPVHPQENFADTWDQDKYDRFKAYITSFRSSLKQLLYPAGEDEQRGPEKSVDQLTGLFGGREVKEAIQIEASEMNRQREAGKLAVTSAGLLTGISWPSTVAVRPNQFFGR